LQHPVTGRPLLVIEAALLQRFAGGDHLPAVPLCERIYALAA